MANASESRPAKISAKGAPQAKPAVESPKLRAAAAPRIEGSAARPAIAVRKPKPIRVAPEQTGDAPSPPAPKGR
jgi:hypothetical protein